MIWKGRLLCELGYFAKISFKKIVLKLFPVSVADLIFIEYDISSVNYPVNCRDLDPIDVRGPIAD